MKRMLINATQEEELRVALVDGQKLYDLNIERITNISKKSNIYKGKIVKIEPSLEAVFVDYGTKKHGFLPFKEIACDYFDKQFNNNSYINVKNLLREGQELIVQISKEERGKKSAYLTTFISLAGSYLVLMPKNSGLEGVSRKISGLERCKIKNIISILKTPKSMGIIIRTAGLGKSIKSLQLDLNIRIEHWDTIKKVADSKEAPFLIYQESNIIIRAFRDYLQKDIGEILIDNPKMLELASQNMKLLGRLDFLNKIKLYKGNVPLFIYYQIESQINLAFERKVKLNSGGSIIIDSTEALITIDINSAKSMKGTDIKETAFNTNLEAIEEICRQLRLRDLGGLIVIDFIEMNDTNNKKIIINKLKSFLKNDRARIQISDISQFGLLEMSRERLSSSLEESNYHNCPRCNGFGKIRDNKSLSLLILRLIEQETIKENTHEVHAIVPIDVACYLLNEKRKSISDIERRDKGKRVIIVPSDKIQTPFYSIFRIRKGHDINSESYHLYKFHKNNKKYFFNLEKNNFDNLNKNYSENHLLHNNSIKCLSNKKVETTSLIQIKKFKKLLSKDNIFSYIKNFYRKFSTIL